MAPSPPSPPTCSSSPALVVLELKVETAAGIEGVEVKRPALVTSASALLVFGVQRILARVKLLSHFWKGDRKNEGTRLRL